jgi:lysophospholipase L1-like esterase
MDRTRSQRLHRVLLSGVVAVAVTMSVEARASTINQNTSWTINKSGATTTYRVVAYGDSIFAGYYGQLFSVAKRAAPLVDGEYGLYPWNANVQVVRRTKSGAVASDIYKNKIVGEKSYMQATSTRVVEFEMCGNDGLQARSNFAGQTGTCNYAPLDNALANCTTYLQQAMVFINANAYSGTKVKMVSNLYYPGYAADNKNSSCTVSGSPVNMQNTFLPYLAKMNWRACNFANTYGFKCTDSFAQFMAADYDTNALAYVQGESEAAYVTRITTTNRASIRDANTHFVDTSTSYDYIQSDNTHPTYDGSGTIGLNIFTGSGSGSGSPDFTASQIVGGKNPVWNQYGHERMGWGLSVFNPATP